MIYLNIFNILVLDVNKIDKSILNKKEKQVIIYRHESFQLWESDIFGFLLKKTHNFIVLNKDGIGVYSLGSRHKQVLIDDNGAEKVLHSLEGYNFLKIEKYNNIVF